MTSVGQRNYCVNCCRPTHSTNVGCEKGGIFHEIPFETHHNNNNNNQEDDEERELTTTTVKVRSVLSSIYNLNYWDDLKSFVDTDNLSSSTHADYDDQEVGVCESCFDVLCNLFKYYDEFNYLRKIDSHLNNKIVQLNDLVHRLPTIANRATTKSEVEEEEDSDTNDVNDNDDSMEHRFNSINYRSASSSQISQENQRNTSIDNKKKSIRLSQYYVTPTLQIRRLNQNEITAAAKRITSITASKNDDDDGHASPEIIDCKVEPFLESDEENDDDVEDNSGDDNYLPSHSDDCLEEEPERSPKVIKQPQASTSKKRSKRAKISRIKPPRKRQKRGAAMETKGPVLADGTCPICQESFNVPKNLTMHLLTHNADKSSLTCPLPTCSESFKNREYLLAHIKHCHTLDRVPVCPVCQKRCTTVKDLNTHMKTHRKDNIYICEKCHLQFPSVDLLETHRTTTHPKIGNSCPGCPGKNFESELLLNAHMREVHPGEKLFACPNCGETFGFKMGLYKHLQRTHPLPGSQLYKCPLNCGRVYRTEEELKRHEDSNVCEGERVYVCRICDKSFKKRHRFILHEQLHKGEAPEFKCTVGDCGRIFHTAQSRSRHQHTHTQVRAFTCHECGLSLKSSSVLQKHMKIHSETKTHLCSVCGKRFLRLEGLTKHMRVHSDVRDHLCQFCPKTFKYPDSLRLHVLSTHKPAAFTCQFCQAGFPYKFILERHLTSAHGQP